VDSGFAKPLALEGEKIIDLLKSRLTDAQDDWTVDDDVLVLKDMVRLETYDVVGDEELMRLVDERVKAMKDPGMKEMTQGTVDTIREWSARARLLTVENGREPVKRKKMFSLLRSEGFRGAPLDMIVDFWPIGEIEAGSARFELFIYVDNPEYIGWKETPTKELLIFSQSHYLGSYYLDLLPTGIRGNRLEFPCSEAEGNSIVFDSEHLPWQIHIGGKVQQLSK